jgi:peptidylprolyl isomerase
MPQDAAGNSVSVNKHVSQGVTMIRKNDARFRFPALLCLSLLLAGGCRTSEDASETPSAKEKKPSNISTLNPNAIKPTPLPPRAKPAEAKKHSEEFPAPKGLPDGLYAELRTTAGPIIIQLFPDRTPLTVANFVGLAEGTKYSTRQGNRFYDGTNFHRVVYDFVVQGGDPTGTGKGGPGYTFPDEFHPELRHDGLGVVSMANSGPDSNGSQFFITMKATPWLDDRHSIFGRVVRGQEILFEIKQGDILQSVQIHRIGDGYKSYTVTQAIFDSLRNSLFSRDDGKIKRQPRDRRSIPQKW